MAHFSLDKYKGNIFVIATGRSAYDFNKKAEKYKLNYDYVILNHGTTILDKNNTVIENCCIDNKIIKNLEIDLDINNAISNFCCNLENSRASFNDKDILKIHCKYSSKEKAMQINEIINNKYSKYINSYYVTGDAVEIITNKTDKSKAIEIIAKLEEIPKANIYIIGDGFSDIEMIKKFNGYCMENSVEELLMYCKDKKVKNVSELINIIY